MSNEGGKKKHKLIPPLPLNSKNILKKINQGTPLPSEQ
jgi:hypothetical protein